LSFSKSSLCSGRSCLAAVVISYCTGALAGGVIICWGGEVCCSIRMKSPFWAGKEGESESWAENFLVTFAPS
jgi:hypothetical protein